MNTLEAVRLTPLMERSCGDPQITIGLIDGPVAINHPGLAHANVRTRGPANCDQPLGSACSHGTFVAGILFARRGGFAPSICPSCTMLVRPIFGGDNRQIAAATPAQLASAIVETVDAGAQMLNMSIALSFPSTKEERVLKEALDYACRRGVLVVAAAGNQGTLGSSAIIRHSWVIPVVASNFEGQPLRESNLGSSIGRRGVAVPAQVITSLGVSGQPLSFGGTSAATPFVTGTIALLWSLFPDATAEQLKFAILQSTSGKRTAVVPPMLNAWRAYQILVNGNLNLYGTS